MSKCVEDREEGGRGKEEREGEKGARKRGKEGKEEDVRKNRFGVGA